MKKFIMAKFIGLLLTGHVTAQVAPGIYEFAHAVAKAEGFTVKGSLPNRLHNPGDIRAVSAHQYPGQIGIDKKRYAIFKNDAAGWAALYHQIEKVADGSSAHYGPQTTIRQFSRRYAEVSSPWLKNVCSILVISPSTTFERYFNSNRSLVLAAERAPVDPMQTFDYDFLGGTQ